MSLERGCGSEPERSSPFFAANASNREISEGTRSGIDKLQFPVLLVCLVASVYNGLFNRVDPMNVLSAFFRDRANFI